MCSMVKREMTITHEEFLRVFTTAFTKEIIAQGLDFFVIDVDGKEVRIHLNPEKRKKIASLEWIVTDVDLDLTGLPPEASSRFMVRFERAFQKGGG